MQSGFSKVPSELSLRITRLLGRRHEQILPVQAEIARWREIDTSLTDLAAALGDLRRHPSVSPGDASALTIPHLDGIRADIAETVEAYSAVEARFSRETVNIGVSGSARVGKSTLLQSISGLIDEQIPTGRDIPVTAVRSRIYHSTRPPIALLRLHSPETFLGEVISPYHQALHMTRVPGTLDEFRTWAYPDSPQGPEARSGDVALLRRLREMQEALWSYEKDLTGGDKTVRLEDLRPYVAYPTSAERAASSRLEHRYLAVSDVRIDCEFPQADVDQLGIVDLPGLGEVAADAEKHHVTGLRHDVDVVLLVKRAAEGMAFWSAADSQAINLLDDARGSIRNRGDFVYLVVNSRPDDVALADALRADIVRQVNDGQENRYFTILSTDAANPDLVREEVLSPLLHALADRLPIMDQEFLAGARDRAEAIRSRIRSALSELTVELSHLKTTSGDAREELEGKAKQLHENLMYALGALVRELEVQATSDEDDPEYVAAIEAAYSSAHAWIEGGFGVGEQAWCKEAVNSFGKARASAKYTTDQLNLIRVAISGFYAKLNDYFSARVEEARRQVGVILQVNLGTLLAEIDPAGEKAGTALLKRVINVLSEASPPCDDLAAAVQVLVDLNLEYRTQFHPGVREQLEGLRAELEDPETGRRFLAIAVDLDDTGARQLYTYCSERARQAAHKTRNALLAEKITPLLVIYAAVEQFEDALIRSGTSERDFERLAFSYRDELWPGMYAGLTEAHARYAKVTRLIKSISEKLA
jgi:hypothetical protein